MIQLQRLEFSRLVSLTRSLAFKRYLLNGCEFEKDFALRFGILSHVKFQRSNLLTNKTS